MLASRWGVAETGGRGRIVLDSTVREEAALAIGSARRQGTDWPARASHRRLASTSGIMG